MSNTKVVYQLHSWCFLMYACFLRRSGQSCSYSKRSTSFHSVNKQQPGNWQAAPLDVWWNNCILICTEIWLEKADLEPNHTSDLWRFFFLSFSFLSPDRLIFLFSAGWPLVLVSLHSTTLQNTLSQGSILQLSRLLLSVSLTDGALLYKVLKAHKLCKFGESTFWVWYLTVSCVCSQYFQSTIPGWEFHVSKML